MEQNTVGNQRPTVSTNKNSITHFNIIKSLKKHMIEGLKTLFNKIDTKQSTLLTINQIQLHKNSSMRL